jgi:hypothetical protein
VTVNDLKQFLDKTVTLRMTDGEIAKVRVDFIDAEYEDIIADVLETSRPERYGDRFAAFTFAAADIVSAELSE